MGETRRLNTHFTLANGGEFMSGEINNRRRFLAVCTDGVVALLGACIAVPALAYVLAPVRRWTGRKGAGEDFQNVGALEQLPLDQWHLVSLQLTQRDGWEEVRLRHGVWVRRSKDPAKIEVLSSICPHLGCPLNWHPDHAEFVCPCHGGVFDAQGRHIAGPPPRSMDSLEYRVENGYLFIRWQDFKVGVAERIPVRT
jgi:menaquinol-cytochrome c reductase iron-sulfur subunit